MVIALSGCVRTKSCALVLLLTATLLQCLLPHFCSAAEPPGQCRQTFEIEQDFQLNRRFVIAEDAPTAILLRSRADLKERIQPMTNLLSNIVKAIDLRRQNKDLKQCNLIDVNYGWVYTSRLSSESLQIGKLDHKCYSELDDSDAVSSGLLSRDVFDNSMHVIGDGVQALYEAVSSISQSPQTQGAANWTNSFPLRSWSIGDDIQTCSVETFSAYRIRNRFFLRASMTNHMVEKYVEDWRRQFVNEWVRDDYSQSLKMEHPNVEDGQRICGTTLLERWNARAWISWHGEMKDDENPAIRISSQRNEVKIDLAEDSIAAANIALITLPMVMNLLPFALIAEFTTLGSLLYVIFTDVISVVPFLVKGIELVITTRSNPALVAYYVGDEELADVQVWAADCSGTGRFRVIGWIFIVVGAFVIVLGIGLEFVAKAYMDKKREEGDGVVVGPFGSIIFEPTGVLGPRFGQESETYSLYTTEIDTMETGSQKAEVEDGSLEAKQNFKQSALKWIWILLQSSPLGAWAGFVRDPRTANDEQPGVGRDGFASAERFDMHDETGNAV